MIKTRYDHLIYRVEYPMERGYRMEASELPSWIFITITEDKESKSKYLTVHSRIHVNTSVRINPEYCSSFSDTDIIKDLSSEVFSRFIK